MTVRLCKRLYFPHQAGAWMSETKCSMPHTPRIPDLPGELVPSEFVEDLRRHVSQLCQINIIKFPGSQPVSFAQRDLARLENEDYWVCEKSDGVRVLFFVHTVDNDSQMVYLIDRHNQYRLLNGFFFPHHENPRVPLRSTIVDGELVIDTDPRTRQDTLRLLAFDCLVVDNQNVMSRTLDKRYGRLQEWFFKPYRKMMQDHPHMMQNQPFDIKVKAMNLSYGLEKVFNEDIPKLQHGNDGLIYTCLQSPYVVGTDHNILKWKPPSENTIDFKLILRFPPDPKRPSEPDFLAKPIFGLHVFVGGRDNYDPFDELYVDDDEWEKLKVSGEQVDDRVVEVFWESAESRWRMMRFRDDKPNGNHKSVVDNIIQCIIDGVEKKDLLARSNAVRTAWKARQGQQARPTPADGHFARGAPPSIDLRYGSLQESPYSRVGGPPTVLGFNR
ncbi:mRNA capping enzyme, alpha subunit [Phellopilus nigrolimitatus]|nr:mRNA capping enzyme, alpha subunit [Phellopilus nigrolimitatus]